MKKKSIKSTIRNLIAKTVLGGVFLEWKKKANIKYGLRQQIKSYEKEARNMFNSGLAPHGTLEDYLNALRKHWVSYSEYMYQYEFWNLSESERENFISRLSMISFYRLALPSDIKGMFWNKVRFLRTFSPYIHRKWIDTTSDSYDDFYQLITTNDYILKPQKACCGQGISKCNKLPPGDYHDLMKEYANNSALLEECIDGCDELQRFHPQSLNTIRVVTVKQGGTQKVFHSFFRMGTGAAVVDNAHAGGLFAQIDIETGVIDSEAINVNGERVQRHPDTDLQIIGYQIPRWKEIKELCESAATLVPGTFIVGWDITITRDGIIEVIEGNHGPDFDVMQSPHRVGLKKKICQAIQENYSNYEFPS